RTSTLSKFYGSIDIKTEFQPRRREGVYARDVLDAVSASRKNGNIDIEMSSTRADGGCLRTGRGRCSDCEYGNKKHLNSTLEEGKVFTHEMSSMQ
ncbi:unnamed protein product, partial [Mycena citricolor]